MSEIAKKHIDISIKTKELAHTVCVECESHVATHKAHAYQRIEEESQNEFWSIKAWTQRPHRPLKDPDLIITHHDHVRYFIEVKWGTAPDNPRTDLIMGIEEWVKINRLLRTSSVMCRIRGPAARDGKRFKSPEFLFEKDFTADIKSQLVLVSDFVGVKQRLPKKLDQFMELWNKSSPSFQIADINVRVDKIPPLAEILAR